MLFALTDRRRQEALITGDQNSACLETTTWTASLEMGREIEFVLLLCVLAYQSAYVHASVCVCVYLSVSMSVFVPSPLMPKLPLVP